VLDLGPDPPPPQRGEPCFKFWVSHPVFSYVPSTDRCAAMSSVARNAFSYHRTETSNCADYRGFRLFVDVRLTGSLPVCLVMRVCVRLGFD